MHVSLYRHACIHEEVIDIYIDLLYCVKFLWVFKHAALHTLMPKL